MGSASKCFHALMTSRFISSCEVLCLAWLLFPATVAVAETVMTARQTQTYEASELAERSINHDCVHGSSLH